jgi:hypothetical protein
MINSTEILAIVVGVATVYNVWQSRYAAKGYKNKNDNVEQEYFLRQWALQDEFLGHEASAGVPYKPSLSKRLMSIEHEMTPGASNGAVNLRDAVDANTRGLKHHALNDEAMFAAIHTTLSKLLPGTVIPEPPAGWGERSTQGNVEWPKPEK